MEDVSSIGVNNPVALSAHVPTGRKTAGRWLIGLASAVLGATIVGQALYAEGATSVGFENWRPVLYAFIGWSVVLGAG